MNRQRKWPAVLAAAGTCDSRRCSMKVTGMRAIGRMGVAATVLAMSVGGAWASNPDARFFGGANDGYAMDQASIAILPQGTVMSFK